MDVDFSLEAPEAGVELPEPLTNQVGGSSVMLKIPVATDGSKVVDVYLNGDLIESNQAQGSPLSVTLPNEDAVISFSYHAA